MSIMGHGIDTHGDGQDQAREMGVSELGGGGEALKIAYVFTTAVAGYAQHVAASGGHNSADRFLARQVISVQPML
jgi:hypothetical protein